MNGKKIISIFIGFICFSSLALGVIGFLEHKKSTTKTVVERDYQVTYKYYLNNKEVSQMPLNPKLVADEEGSSIEASSQADVEKLYAFNTYSCTNNVTGSWNDSTWSFKHSNTADATCSLYFVTTYNVVKIELTNAKLNSKDEIKINRGEDAVVKVTPNEGYEFDKDSVTCTNNEVVDWDKDAKEIIVRSVNAPTTCSIKFSISKFTVETQVNNGTGSTKVEYEYGKKVEIKTSPAEGYGTPDISCTNDQAATWEDDTLVIEKLTNNTKCVLTFKKLQTKVEYTATMDAGDHGTISSGASSVKVLEGASVSWTITANEGYALDDVNCTNGTVTKSGTGPSYVVKVDNVTSNTECSITYKANTNTPTE